MNEVLRQKVIDAWAKLETAKGRFDEISTRRIDAQKQMEAFRLEFAATNDEREQAIKLFRATQATLKSQREAEWTARQIAMKAEYDTAEAALKAEKRNSKWAERDLAEDSAKESARRAKESEAV